MKRHQIAAGIVLCIIAALWAWRTPHAQIPLPPSGADIQYQQLLQQATRRGNPESVAGDWTFSGNLRFSKTPTAGYAWVSDASGTGSWAALGSGAIASVAASALPTWIVADSASVDSTARVASMALHTLYVPVVAGLYRVSVLQEVTTAAAAGSVLTTIGWTDDNGAQTATPAAGLTLGGVGYDQGQTLIRVASGSITYKADVSGLIGTPVYSVFIRLERP